MEFITIELRPQLRSCTVFLLIRKNIVLNNVQIKLLEGSIVLSINQDVTTLLLLNIKIIPTSLSSLNVVNNWICFRLQTQPVESEFGSFHSEVITNVKWQSTVLEENFKKRKTLLKQCICMILCTCCKNNLSKELRFKRVLPFPSFDYDPSEWFCCKQNSDFTGILHPHEVDYFYGLFYSVLNKNIFNDHVHTNKKDIICNRCLLNIGTQLENGSFKIWNCCVDYQLMNNQSINNQTSDPLNDFMIVVGSSMTDMFTEIVLECLTNEQTHYIIIKPMDMQLGLLTETNAVHNNNVLCLHQTHVIKVLYKYGVDRAIVDRSHNMNTKYYDVCMSIIEAGLNYLSSSTKRFPKAYRTAEDYYIGHINLENFVN